MKRLTELAHELVAPLVKPGDTAIDGTTGNGNDTLFLATLVGPTGRVYAFDVQAQALAGTAIKASQNRHENIEFCLNDHAEMAAVVPEKYHGHVAAVMFNLGFLPGSDHVLMTSSSTTVTALQQAFTLLKPAGVLSVMAYPGHPGGPEEMAAVRAWTETLGAAAEVSEPQVGGEPDNAPHLFLVTKVAIGG